jgi:hypothetical protein
LTKDSRSEQPTPTGIYAVASTKFASKVRIVPVFPLPSYRRREQQSGSSGRQF